MARQPPSLWVSWPGYRTAKLFPETVLSLRLVRLATITALPVQAEIDCVYKSRGQMD
jgi:hypothetical protein